MVLARLRSPLPHAEIILGIIRDMKLEYTRHRKANRNLVKGNYKKFLEIFGEEFKSLDHAAEKIRVLEVRLEEQLKTLDLKLNRYRKSLAGHPEGRHLLHSISLYLKKIRSIRSSIKTEANRSLREESTIASVARHI
ncbi:hypothetical protein KY347_01725 [Candidatus Woesearchaeota archaeon]|nr:hypothetical protein [Candidatus Woesearchaeota archaeon]